MKNYATDVKNVRINQEIINMMKSVPPEEPIEKRKQIQELNNIKRVIAKPPKIKITTGAQIDTLPPKLKAIVMRANEDEEYYLKIKQVLSTAVSRLTKHARDHETFCDFFNLSSEPHKYLLKLFGLSEAELKQEMAKINFYPGHRQLGDSYYQTLSLTFLIGLYKDDEILRIVSLILISARLWNGMVKKFFTRGCSEDIARYVQQYLIQNNSDYKRYGTPFAFVVNYLAIRINETFSSYVRQNAADPKTGLVKILKSIQPSLLSLFKGTLAKRYYEAYEKGLKETSVSSHQNAYDGGGDMIETRESFKNLLEQMVDKLEKNIILASNILLSDDAKSILKRKFALSDSAIKKINDWFEDDENSDDIKMLTEYLIQGIRPETEEQFCSMTIDVLANQIGNSKKNAHFIKIKDYRKLIAKAIFGPAIEDANASSYSRILNIISYSILIYIKKLICKKVS